MVSAAPPPFAAQLGLDLVSNDSVVLLRCKAIPFIHFNCVMNLGMTSMATEAQLDHALAQYRQVQIQDVAIFHTPCSQPAALPQWLEARKLSIKGGWDRIYRDNTPLVAPALPSAEFHIERITRANGHGWAEFVCAVYGMPVAAWLSALVDRPGWHHYALHDGGKMVAARSMYVSPDATAWLGIDAPVPGLMGPTFDLDARLVFAMLQDGLKLGVRLFSTDVEAVSADKASAAYQHFSSMGFRHAYLRSHYCS